MLKEFHTTLIPLKDYQKFLKKCQWKKEGRYYPPIILFESGLVRIVLVRNLKMETGRGFTLDFEVVLQPALMTQRTLTPTQR